MILFIKNPIYKTAFSERWRCKRTFTNFWTSIFPHLGKETNYHSISSLVVEKRPLILRVWNFKFRIISLRRIWWTEWFHRFQWFFSPNAPVEQIKIWQQSAMKQYESCCITSLWTFWLQISVYRSLWHKGVHLFDASPDFIQNLYPFLSKLIIIVINIWYKIIAWSAGSEINLDEIRNLFFEFCPVKSIWKSGHQKLSSKFQIHFVKLGMQINMATL